MLENFSVWHVSLTKSKEKNPHHELYHNLELICFKMDEYFSEWNFKEKKKYIIYFTQFNCIFFLDIWSF